MLQTWPAATGQRWHMHACITHTRLSCVHRVATHPHPVSQELARRGRKKCVIVVLCEVVMWRGMSMQIGCSCVWCHWAHNSGLASLVTHQWCEQNAMRMKQMHPARVGKGKSPFTSHFLGWHAAAPATAGSHGTHPQKSLLTLHILMCARRRAYCVCCSCLLGRCCCACTLLLTASRQFTRLLTLSLRSLMRL